MALNCASIEKTLARAQPSQFACDRNMSVRRISLQGLFWVFVGGDLPSLKQKFVADDGPEQHVVAVLDLGVQLTTHRVFNLRPWRHALPLVRCLEDLIIVNLPTYVSIAYVNSHVETP